MKIKKIAAMCFLMLAFSTLAAEKNEEIQMADQESKTEFATDYFNVYDPWEGFNRRMYAFNYYFDKYLFLPTVATYKFLVPELAQDGVSNFFNNVGQSSTLINATAQGKGRKAMRAMARFSINSILGIFGIFDVATKLDMPKEYEDVGLTLAHYGVPAGPYLVLPVLGPSNLRDGAGVAIAFATADYIIPYDYIKGVEMTSIGVRSLQAVDTRKRNSFRYYGTGSPFEYDYTRFFYKEFRELQANSD